MCILSIVSMLSYIMYHAMYQLLCSVEFLQHSVDLPADGCLVAEIQQIVCQVVHYIYRRLKTIEIFKQPPLKVVAYKRWSPIRGSVYSDLT